MKTSVIDIGDDNCASYAAGILNKGGTIIYPTETLYGLGCISTNKRGFLNIYEIKHRSFTKPFPVLAKDIDMVTEYAFIPDYAFPLMNKFWPGALTLILNLRKRVFPDLSGITKNVDKVGFRISSHFLVRNLFNFVDKPIISTSANISGTENLYSFEELKEAFDNKVDLIINSGTISASKGSTIVDCTVTPPNIVREGDITRNEIYDYI